MSYGLRTFVMIIYDLSTYPNNLSNISIPQKKSRHCQLLPAEECHNPTESGHFSTATLTLILPVEIVVCEYTVAGKNFY